MKELTCFKAYDIRGQLGSQLNTNIAYRIGRAFGIYLSPKADKTKTVVVGGDNRLTSNELKLAVADGLMDSGVNVVDIGMTGTEEVYFATQHLQLDGGIEVTASHNPIDYNGMKLVLEQSKPLSNDTGLKQVKQLAEENNFPAIAERGVYTQQSNLNSYTDFLMTYMSSEKIRPMKLVMNSGNGAAGHVIDAIEQRFKALNLPIELIKVHHEPDGTFPNGIPNPLLPERRADTQNAVIEHKADMGIAWDGDFDRCFMFDEHGTFIEGYYIVGLLAKVFLQKNSGEKIIHDPRLSWNTIDVVTSAGGIPIQSKTGHAFIKQVMRDENAIYGGEMSAHHYFRDFGYCDSGMLPWLLMLELISTSGKTLSDLVMSQIANYPSSGEINRKLKNPQQVINDVLNKYKQDAVKIEYIDGISLEFPLWRFNLRASNTEPLVRLNVESRGDVALMEAKTEEILTVLTD